MGHFAELCRGSFFEEVCILKWKFTFFYFGDAALAVEKNWNDGTMNKTCKVIENWRKFCLLNYNYLRNQ